MRTSLPCPAERPALFEQTEFSLWDDDRISEQMLKAHLNPTLDAASRNALFIRRSANWIASLISPCQGKRLLDLGCGPGLYTALFHQAGCNVCGMDISRRSIDYARTHTDKKITYLCGDYLALDFPKDVDLATMIYCDFGVLSFANRTRLLQKTYNALTSGGKFVFDVFTPAQYDGQKEESFVETDVDADFWTSQKHRLTDDRFYYPNDCTWLHRVVVETKNGIKRYHIWEHLFTAEEIRRDLTAVGFKNITLYGDIAGTPLSAESKTLCIVAET